MGANSRGHEVALLKRQHQLEAVVADLRSKLNAVEGEEGGLRDQLDKAAAAEEDFSAQREMWRKQEQQLRSKLLGHESSLIASEADRYGPPSPDFPSLSHPFPAFPTRLSGTSILVYNVLTSEWCGQRGVAVGIGGIGEGSRGAERGPCLPARRGPAAARARGVAGGAAGRHCRRGTAAAGGVRTDERGPDGGGVILSVFLSPFGYLFVTKNRRTRT